MTVEEMRAAFDTDEKLAAELERLGKENEILKADVAQYVEQKQADSEAFARLRAKLGVFASAAQGVVDLHEEHKASGD